MTKNLVMIHGMWGGGWYWQPMKTFFGARGYTCHTPDLRYHGESAGNDPHPGLGTTSIQDYVDDLAELLRSLPEKPVVIGHSMGGLIAQKLAEQGLVGQLILACPAPPDDVLAISWAGLKSLSPLMLTPGFWKKPTMPSFENAVKSSFQLIPANERREYYDRLCHDSGKVLLEIALPFLDKRSAAKVASSKVQCPTLVLSAELDKLIPAQVVKKVANKYPQAAYHCFTGQTHWVIAEKGWEACAEYIAEWLDRLAAAEDK
ncbi:alpha/beta hydrolase [Pseudomaricurvus sp.]|uniref:alpha/beta hydrolase n=1 Tax=Pseudomaricurvus sp. TaxID=2004510 RepID=UPI003F6C0CF1